MRTLVTFALAACLLTSCRSNPTAVAAATPSLLTPTPTEFFPPTPALLPRGTRIIIQSANLSLTVDDPAKALAQIEGAVMELGGFVVSSNSWSSPGSPASSSLTLTTGRSRSLMLPWKGRMEPKPWMGSGLLVLIGPTRRSSRRRARTKRLW